MTVESTKTSMQVGRVVADRMQNTVTVLVERKVKHPKYGKYMKRSTKLHAHDAANEYQVGDWVNIRSCRPISKTKFWQVVSKVQKS